MKKDLQFKLQAYLDGELASDETQTVRDWLAVDPAARDLLVELTNTQAALTTCEPAMQLPETREFYWSKIRRQIEREAQVKPVSRPVSMFLWLRRSLASAAVVAAVVVGLMLSQRQSNATDFVAVASFADSETFTYRDYDSGTTLVWLTYPAENEFAEHNPADTLQLD